MQHEQDPCLIQQTEHQIRNCGVVWLEGTVIQGGVVGVDYEFEG